MTTGYVYKLCCTDITVTEIYVGSTKSLRNRKAGHKSACINETNKHHNLPVYQYIRSHGGWDNWTMVMIDTMTYTEKIELKKRERKWIEDLHATLNACIPTRTLGEWYEDNKEEVSKNGKLYYAQNAGYIKQRVKNYAELHTEQIKEYRQFYAVEHKEQIADYQRQYREENGELISKQRSQRIICECGSLISKRNLSSHRHSAKHAALLAAKTIPASDIVPDSEPVEDAAKNATQTF